MTITEQNLVEVELDLTLQPTELKHWEPSDFNKSISTSQKDDMDDYFASRKGQEVAPSFETVRDCIKGTYRHKSFLYYISKAYANHYGVVLRPDFLWQVVLSEVAGHIKSNASDYKHLFTNSEKKVEISIPTKDTELIDLNVIKQHLRKLVPTDIEAFLPEFTTTDEASSLAMTATFADAMTPYYNYSMYCCGITKVRLEGQKEDWMKAYNRITDLANLMPKLSDYFKKVALVFMELVGAYLVDKSDYFKDIFSFERCGSGGQKEVKGWITDLYITYPRIGYIENFPTSIAKVPYKNLTTNKNYELLHGLFSSNLEEGYLVPEFGYIINEMK